MILAPSAASRPIGPAPVTSTVRGSQKDRRPISAHLLQRFRDDRRRLEKHAPSNPRAGSTLTAYSCTDSPALGHEAVNLLDAALGVPAVAAHVPLTHGAARARDGIRVADDAHDQIPLLEIRGTDRGR